MVRYFKHGEVEIYSLDKTYSISFINKLSYITFSFHTNRLKDSHTIIYLYKKLGRLNII